MVIPIRRQNNASFDVFYGCQCYNKQTKGCDSAYQMCPLIHCNDIMMMIMIMTLYDNKLPSSLCIIKNDNIQLLIELLGCLYEVIM